MRWVMYGVAVLATVAAAFLWWFVLGQSRVSALPPFRLGVDSPAPVAVPPVAVARVPAPSPMRVQTACMSGVTWVYDGSRGRWFRTSPVVPCSLGTVRSENDREGLIERHPKGWQPGH